MTVDMKDWIQNRAEELAARGFLLVRTGLITWNEDEDYYNLPEAIRDGLYAKAMEDWKDYYASLIDSAYDREKERQLLG